MTMLKTVKTRFNKASLSYDEVSKAQQISADILISKILELKPSAPKKILDLGTGTGYIPKILISKFKETDFYLNDIAEQMLEKCKNNFSSNANVHYLPGDMMLLEKENYDWIISNLAFQWMDDLESALKFFHAQASDIFAFSTIAFGTFSEWEDILNKYEDCKLKQYPTNLELIKMCNKIKDQNESFEFDMVNIPLKFNSAAQFMHYLKNLGASATPCNGLSIKSLRSLLKEELDINLTVSYKIFFGIFRKCHI